MDRRFGWVAVFTAILGAVVVGIASYNAGVSHGLAAGALANAPAAAVLPYGWYRPWGFGFGFGPIFLVLFWFLALRMIWEEFTGAVGTAAAGAASRAASTNGTGTLMSG